ncbi:MAG TPA: flagellar basal body P-ring formation chaperone FlgA [Tepidisphaeraceae bacterium]|nr:flagellar basal body P-ring formation chaperone FlgA [Tepidisphaeraceae bacterium]
MKINPRILTLLFPLCGLALTNLARAEDAGKMQEITTTSVERYEPMDVETKVGSLELRPEAQVIGNDVTLASICRWNEQDNAYFAPIADLIVARLNTDGFATISVGQIRSLLHDAGVNLATLNLSGAGSCQISRSDVKFDEQRALQQWLVGDEVPADDYAQAALVNAVVVQMEARTRPSQMSQPVEQSISTRDLKSILVSDLATRLNIPVDSIQLDFSEEDRKVLALSEPLFQFGVEAQKYGTLGNVSWIVTIHGGTEKRRVSLSGFARAWREQLVVQRPLASGQTISNDDVEIQRVLTNQSGEDAPLGPESVIGQQASRDLRVGSVITSRVIQPVDMVRTNDLVTVRLRIGEIEITAVAKSMEAGTLGQSIKVRNETTKQTYQVTVTGHQTGDVTSVGQ